jgi:uncharacterized protein YbjT (DUF2867 family)
MSQSASQLKVLVLLSTGKQGSAVVSELSSTVDPSGNPRFVIQAVTRNPDSDSAKRLASLSNVTLLQGSTATDKSADELFTKAGPLDGLVMIQLDADEHPGGYKGEIEEGKRLIDTAKRHGVKHIVYHGMELPDPTPVDSEYDYVKPKIQVPAYLAKESDDGKAFTWTWLKPHNFFENLIGISPFCSSPESQADHIVPGQTAFMITFLTLVENQPMQFISIKDIAFFSAQSLLNPQMYHGRGVGLAGDLVMREKFEKEWRAAGLPEHFLTDVPPELVKGAIAGAPLEGLAKVSITCY